MNFVCDRTPPLPGLVERFYANIIRCAIECDPGHHFGMDEVLPSAAHLPNPFIRLPPGFREILQNQRTHGPATFGRRHAGLVRLKRRVRDLAEDIDLHLIAGRVSDPHRRRIRVALEPGQG